MKKFYILGLASLALFSFSACEQPSNSNKATAYSLDDIAKHAEAGDCWTAVDGKVYDITSFVPDHPGGEEIAKACGKDGTSLFKSVDAHEKRNAGGVLNNYLIGDLKS